MYDKQFRFNEDGEFKILLFGDPHENDDVSSEKGKAKRADTLKFHETALDALKPDLAVIWATYARRRATTSAWSRSKGSSSG